jgi:two-component system sensor histidine kinase EvgS
VNHDDAEQLKQRLEQRDRDKVGRMAHRINGGARMMHFTSLKESVRHWNRLQHRAGLGTIEPLVIRVLEEIERFNKWLAFKKL